MYKKIKIDVIIFFIYALILGATVISFEEEICKTGILGTSTIIFIALFLCIFGFLIRRRYKSFLVVCLIFILSLFSIFYPKRVGKTMYIKKGWSNVYLHFKTTGEDLSFTSYKPIKNIDITSFESLNQTKVRRYMYYAKDKNHVYYDGKIVQEADPETFTILNDIYAKDKNHVFYAWNSEYPKKISMIDVKSFEILDSYAKDNKNIYFQTKILPEADMATFSDLGDLYGKDKNHVYSMTYIIEGADPQSFEVIDINYSKDNNHVYFRKDTTSSPEPVPDASPNLYKKSKLQGKSGIVTMKLVSSDKEIKKDDTNLNPEDLKYCFNSLRIWSYQDCFRFFLKNLNTDYKNSDLKDACLKLNKLKIQKCINNKLCEVRQANDPIIMYGDELEKTCNNIFK